MRYNINSNELKSLMFSRVMSRVISEMPGMEDKEFDLATNGVVANHLGLNYDKVSALFNEGCMESEGDYILSGLVKSIDSRVDKFMIKNFDIELNEGMESNRITAIAYRKLVGLEADEEKESEDNPFGETVTEDDVDEKVENDESTIALMISDLIKEIVKTGAPEVSDLAERVIELSKQNLEDNKDVAENDEDTFAVDKGSDDDDDGEEGEDKPKKKKSKKEDDSDDKSKDNKEDNSGNPFEDNEDDKSDKGTEEPTEGGNPFEDDEPEEDDKTGEENATAKLLKSLKCRTFGLEAIKNESHFYPFSGLENAAFNNFSKYIADKMHGENLTSTYNNFGVESENFAQAKSEYVKTAKEVMNASIATILTASIFNVPVETHKLNHVELFS